MIIKVYKGAFMKLSTKGRYCSRAMLDLALHYGNGPVSIREMAQRQEISDRYLENLMFSLVSHGLAKSNRGKGGGFVLTRSPEEVRLLEVIQAAEGSLAPVHCVDNPRECDRSEGCVTFEIWRKLKAAITEILDSITLQDMVNMHRQKATGTKELMYYI